MLLDDLYPIIAVIAVPFAVLLGFDPDGSVWRDRLKLIDTQAKTIAKEKAYSHRLETDMLATLVYELPYKLGPTLAGRCTAVEVAGK